MYFEDITTVLSILFCNKGSKVILIHTYVNFRQFKCVLTIEFMLTCEVLF